MTDEEKARFGDPVLARKVRGSGMTPREFVDEVVRQRHRHSVSGGRVDPCGWPGCDVRADQSSGTVLHFEFDMAPGVRYAYDAVVHHGGRTSSGGAVLRLTRDMPPSSVLQAVCGQEATTLVGHEMLAGMRMAEITDMRPDHQEVVVFLTDDEAGKGIWA